MSKVMINCDEATKICNKNQYKEASFYEKVKLSLHVFLCKKCRLYSEQNNFMTKLFGVHLKKCSEKPMPIEDKVRLKKELSQDKH